MVLNPPDVTPLPDSHGEERRGALSEVVQLLLSSHHAYDVSRDLVRGLWWRWSEL
jgi:hypothetical protein